MRLIITSFILLATSAFAITTGQVEVRVYNGTSFTPTYVTLADGQVITKSSGTPAAITLNAAAVGLGSVENIAISTWAGTTNVTTVGTITTGVWHGTSIGLTYLAAGGATDGQLLGYSDGAWIPVNQPNGVTVGTTNVAGGTSGRLLYNNAGLLGEMALGTGVATALGNAVNAASGFLTYDSDLAIYAGITPSANVQSLLGAADYAAMRTALGLVINTNVQAYDSDLTTWAGITPGTGVSTWLATPSSANLAAALTDETGSGAAVFSTGPVFADSSNVFISGVQPSTGYQVFSIETQGSNGLGFLKLLHLGGYPLYIQDVYGTMQLNGSIQVATDGPIKLGASNLNGVYPNFILCSDTNTTLATLQLGQDSGSTPTTQTLKAHDVTTGTGADLWLAGGTGSVAGGSVILGASATTGSPVAGVTVSPGGKVSIGATGTFHAVIKSGVATLVAGTVTVSDSDVLETGTASTSSRIFVTRMTDSGTLGTGYSITRVNGTSFTITSSSSAETSTVSWLMLNP